MWKISTVALDKANIFSNKQFLYNFSQGLLASKAVGVDGAEKKEDYNETAPMLEQVWIGSIWFLFQGSQLEWSRSYSMHLIKLPFSSDLGIGN